MKSTHLILATILLSLAVATRAADAPKATTRPNLVFFLADDLRPDCLGVLGHPIVKTPNLDTLLANGFLFRNPYVLGSDRGAVCNWKEIGFSGGSDPGGV